MIDLATEHLIPLRDVPRYLPPRPSGKRVHISAVYRWTLRGIKGVILETICVGGTRYTSQEAIQRFSEGLTGPPAARTPPLNVPRVRQRQIEQASAALSKVLGLDRPPRHPNSNST